MCVCVCVCVHVRALCRAGVAKNTPAPSEGDPIHIPTVGNFYQFGDDEVVGKKGTWDLQAPMLILGKNGKKDMLAVGQKTAIAWALDPDNGANPRALNRYVRTKSVESSWKLHWK
jgi:hypothetical protein